MKTKLITVLSLLGTSELFAHGISAADKQNMIDGGYLEYISLGASHMLTGYDHLLFLFGVIFFLTGFKDIVKFISAFTAGHCITLILATFMGISANYYLVDALIALTVVYKGFDNLDGFKRFFNRQSPNLLVLVFSFGLVHGFGLSTRLQMLPLGKEGLLLKILSFNLGVEVGQVVALALMLGVLNLWRKRESFVRFSRLANMGLMAAGAVLFVFQMTGFAGEFRQGEKTMRARESVVTLILKAGQSTEYKFGIDKGAEFVYSWKTDGGELFFDFHGEPADDTTGRFSSYLKDSDDHSAGSFAPPFNGSHGWYWKNKGVDAVTLTLETQGVYTIIGQP